MLPDYFVPEEGSAPVMPGIRARVPVLTAPLLLWGMGGNPHFLRVAKTPRDEDGAAPAFPRVGFRFRLWP